MAIVGWSTRSMIDIYIYIYMRVPRPRSAQWMRRAAWHWVTC